MVPHLANEDAEMDTAGLTFPQNVVSVLKHLLTRKKTKLLRF